MCGMKTALHLIPFIAKTAQQELVLSTDIYFKIQNPWSSLENNLFYLKIH